jgi:thiol-disulfide isomerase/thioredoxin
MKALLGFCLMAVTLAAQPKPVAVNQAEYGKLVAARRGKVVLVNFWATWCLPCRKEMPELVQLSRKLAPRGFDLVMISADEPGQEALAGKVLQDNGAAGAFYLLKTADNDKFYPTVDTTWTSGALPALFLYDRAGRKVRSFMGETSVKELEAAIAKLL